MKFGIVQTECFNAIGGSYSIVTDRELYDSQITATDAEAVLLKSYFESRGETIYRGNVASNRLAAAKEFRLYPSGKVIQLNLVYPKPEKNELRLYLASRRGFMPKKGQVWFLFVSNANALWIGAMDEHEWRQLNAAQRNIAGPIVLDANVERAIEDTRATGQPNARRRRNVDVIDRRLRLSKYKCECDRAHPLFISRATGCPFLEVHHIIPFQYSQHFKSYNLDSLDNLCCLCPSCHSIVHHGEESLARNVLQRLYRRRSIGLHFKLSEEELYRLYSVEEIVRI